MKMRKSPSIIKRFDSEFLFFTEFLAQTGKFYTQVCAKKLEISEKLEIDKK